ncbi:hypothetical protein DEU56DRAFT_329568 [Suillus clintonianus]|uniref:uncharacterized protein n=1 Tax=Suillus clintonianus TaxID=1904413 RepID=UPI001B860306|nr:uncharacterized protein DEU56DRAFT_329568 [Suillus clintonianus]KAG2138954.1 hypothetical protein DEU56DRAFT_329568 [Suillus clintonianus]
MMKAFSKKCTKVFRETHASWSFFCSSSHISRSPVNVTPTEPYIHRLPVELLQQVFLLVVNDVLDCPSIFSSGYGTISVNVASPPLVLTRVCRLWRVVAHSTAGIWSRIQVALPGRVEELTPFLPHLLQCWLVRSGSLPLTLHIVELDTGKPQSYPYPTCLDHYYTWMSSVGDFRILDILISESKRWETVVMPRVYDQRFNFDTPQLRSLECHLSNLGKFYAPNLSCLYIKDGFCRTFPIPTCKDLRHLHLRDASACAICSTIAGFSHLETIRVDEIIFSRDVPAPRACDSTTLEFMTLPLPSPMSDNFRQEFIDVFSLLHLPVLQKLTLVGVPKKRQVDCLLAVLAVASFRVPVVDFQTDEPLSKVYINKIEPLLSIVGEVSFCGNLLQINEHRNWR